jgi:hypothetical protein
MTTSTPIAVPTGPRYSRSFVSYEIPFRPDGPLEFADTEGLGSFYAAYHDSAGRVVRFDKYLFVRGEKKPREVKLRAAQPPGATVYFEVVGDSESGEPSVGKQIDYGATENLGEFFTGEVGPSGETCQAILLRKEILFSDAYEYWPTGSLKKRTTTRSGQTPSVASYDLEGRPLAVPLPELTAGAEAAVDDVFDGR